MKFRFFFVCERELCEWKMIAELSKRDGRGFSQESVGRRVDGGS